MENRWLNSRLRMIEKSIEGIDNPQTCGADFSGSRRTIANNAKMRELENLTQKLAECQQCVQTDSEQAFLDGVKSTLKSRIEIIFNPPMLAT